MTLLKQIRIGDKIVGEDKNAYIIAEIGVNHGGSLDMALKMISEAKKSKADAVKFQTFKADNLLLPDNPSYDFFKNCELSEDDWKTIKKSCLENRIDFISTPFCDESADLLERVQVDAYKVASMDVTNYLLLEYLSKKNKPLIVSTGMATLEEIDETNKFLTEKEVSFAFLHCISLYPAKPSEMHWQIMKMLISRYNCPIGFSDHSLGTHMAYAARIMGALIIEKHFTLDKDLSGPDHKLSADPKELTALISMIRDYEDSVLTYIPLAKRPDLQNREGARRSVCTKVKINKDDIISKDKIKLVRPGFGIQPGELAEVLDKTAPKNYDENYVIPREDFNLL